MIATEGKRRTMTCDGCGDAYDTVQADMFLEMIAAARDSGWTVAQGSNAEWVHRCPDCPAESRLETAQRLFRR